ncbi:hypothetical protein SXCC_02029 [Gluconacetobacter sp. SXCC-1]|nr:hypothetical protein SXCC_02029 [Gluconacetobacter sp. SXCC-1]
MVWQLCIEHAGCRGTSGCQHTDSLQAPCNRPYILSGGTAFSSLTGGQ